MACAGRGRGRGLLQSVMTEGNKQLQLGHSGSCCGAPFPLSLLLLLYALWSRDEWRSGSIKWLQEADEANNERQQQATTALFATVARVAALLLCMTGCGLFFFFFWAACVDKTSIHKCQLVLVRCSCCSSCRCSSLEQLQRKLQHFNIILQPKEAIEETFAACTLSDL